MLFKDNIKWTISLKIKSQIYPGFNYAFQIHPMGLGNLEIPTPIIIQKKQTTTKDI